jgi:drug/metabolite transporter (DMT)-like permease
MMVQKPDENDKPTAVTPAVPASPPPSSTEIVTACITATAVSVKMILLNKAIMLQIPFGGGLVLIQNAATVLLVQIYRRRLLPEDFGFASVRSNMPCALLFGLNTFTSIQTLAYLSITTFTILRNAQPILACPLDYFLRGERLKPASLFFLFTILLGTFAYCGIGGSKNHNNKNDIQSNLEGVLWASMHMVSTTLYAVLTKIRLDASNAAAAVKKEAPEEEKEESDPSSSSSSSSHHHQHQLSQALNLAWYNNVLSLPIVGMAAAAQAVHIIMNPGARTMLLSGCGVYCWIMVAASCFNGCALSIVGLKTQALMTPTSFLTLNNINKIPAMLIAAAIWPHLETVNTTQEIMGIVLSILGGYFYALSKQQQQQQQRDEVVNAVTIFISVALSVALIPIIVLGETAAEAAGGNGTFSGIENNKNNITIIGGGR